MGSLASAPASPSKNKLTKNGPAPDPIHRTNAEGKAFAIYLASLLKTVQDADPEYHPIVNGWFWDAFFRRTSKLGIKFTIQEDKVVHFNRRAPGNPGKARPDSTVDAAAAANQPGRQPITHSEYRYLVRKGLLVSPHVDVYAGESVVNDPR